MPYSKKPEWLAAKKRGRDDDQIERDRKVAQLQRQSKMRGKGKPASVKVRSTLPIEAVVEKTKSVASRHSTKNDRRRASCDTLDSSVDFVVHDDSSMSVEYCEEEASLDEDVLADDDILSASSDDYSMDKKAVATSKRIVSASDDILSSSSVSDFDEDDRKISRFFSKPLKKYSSKSVIPSHKQHKVASKADLKKQESMRIPSRERPKPTASSRKLTDSKICTTHQNVISLDNSDSDMDDCKMPSRSGNIKTTSPLSKERDTFLDGYSLMSSSELFNVSETTSSSPSSNRVRHSEKDYKDALLDLEDTPLLPTAIRKKIKKYQTSNSKTLKKCKKKRYVANAIAEKSNVFIDLQDSSGDENEEGMGADFVDSEEYNEDAVAAKSILATTNELSLLILRTMASWTHSAVDGMIMDGALALSTIAQSDDRPLDGRKDPFNENSSSSEKKADHTWISNDDMLQILPNVRLSEYQLIGVNWLALLHGLRCEVEGGKTKNYANVNGILADEMGLGKTCQTIAFLCWLKHNQGLKNVDQKNVNPHLVIAPASVVSNWVLEFQKFAPHLNVVKYHGSMNERTELQSRLKPYLANRTKSLNGNSSALNSLLAPLDVIIAPVTYFQQEKSDDRHFLKKFTYEYLIVDEAHLLKNSRGMRYKSLDRFKTSHRLLLTGTPVQNSPKELMSLLCFLMPLFSRKSCDEFDETQGHDGGESMLQYFVSIQKAGTNDEEAYKKLKQLFSPFVLRRRKHDVLNQILPPKEQRVEFVELDSASRAIYNDVIADHVRNKKKGSNAAYEHLFTQLRKAAHHPLMLRSRYVSREEKEHLVHWFFQYGAFRGEGCTKEKVAAELEKYTDFDIHLMASQLIDENSFRRSELGRYILDEQDLFSSAKFVRLQQILPNLIADGHRILIFSVWTTCLDLLGCLLEQMGLEFLRMDGQTAVNERQDLIDQFNQNSSIPVFLLSTKACGLGLNLTSADVCIQHDLDFNPFTDLQAEDRCHRIGQTNKVTIIKMVSKNTVDEDIYRMQQRKAKMNAAIMDTCDEWKKSAATVTKEVLEVAVNRFLHSPEAKIRQSSVKENVANQEVIEIL